MTERLRIFFFEIKNLGQWYNIDPHLLEQGELFSE